MTRINNIATIINRKKTHFYERTYLVRNFHVLRRSRPKKCAQAITTTAGAYQTRLDDDQKNPHPRNESLMVTKIANSVRMIHRGYSIKETRIDKADLIEV